MDARRQVIVPLRIVVVFAWAVLVGCGGSGDDAAPSTTVDESITTTERSPDDAFLRSIRSQLTLGGDGAEAAVLDLGQSLCTTLRGIPNSMVEDDAANDSPGSDAAISDLSQTMAIAATFEAFEADRPEVGAVILRATGEHLCPEFRADIEALLSARGYPPESG